MTDSFTDYETLDSANSKIDAAVAAVAPAACRALWPLVVDVAQGTPDIKRDVPCSLAPHPDQPHHALSPLAFQGPFPPVGYGSAAHDKARADYLAVQASQPSAVILAQQAVGAAQDALEQAHAALAAKVVE